MFWYLLYPFRGTTEPPVLSSTHPIRRAFYRHGRNVARHWLAYILLSTVVAVITCYSFFILYEDPASGIAKLPYHVWTSARRFSGNQSVTADISIRQVWVHGSYMRALEPNVLLDALAIQNALIYNDFPSTLTSVGGLDTNESRQINGPEESCSFDVDGKLAWGFHSPLMYWNCSSTALVNDSSLLQTIQEQSNRRSYINVTLRPTSVFAGKHFVNNKLVAADTIVITLFDKTSSTAATRWDARLVKLAAEYNSRWSFYPESGTMTRNMLYEFQFERVSFRDEFVMIITYLGMLAFLAYRLRETRAVKSKLGLVVTVVTEMAISILASLAICSAMQVDLAGIPPEMYPFVIIVIGMENMLRMMNAVSKQPPQSSTTLRISKALGDVGHLSLASAAQNLTLLWLMSKVVSHGVRAFCIFASVALVFEFFFHLTFFVAVLSVDVRRMELQDSLDRADSESKTAKKPRLYWIDALLKGQIPMSTRVAGSAISICFTLAMNMHLADADSVWRLIIRACASLFGQNSTTETLFAFGPPPPINQARTPQTWLRLQDYQTAQDIIGFVKPTGQHLIARVYDPLTIVLKGSDRRQSQAPTRLLSQFSEVLNRHVYPFVLVLVFAICLITLLMQYLLWSELPEMEVDEPVTRNKSVLDLKRLPASHSLDIFKLATSPQGHVVAVSLDRTITLSIFNASSQTYTTDRLDRSNFSSSFWPITNAAIDDKGSWVALSTTSGHVAFWRISTRTLSHFAKVFPSRQKPLLFTLSSLESTNSDTVALVTVLPNGSATVMDVDPSSSLSTFKVSDHPLRSATTIQLASRSHVVALAHSGHVLIASFSNSKLSIVPLHEFDLRISALLAIDPVQALYPLQELSALIVLRRSNIDLIDLSTRLLIHSFKLSHSPNPPSLRLLHSSPRPCRTCQSPSIFRLSLVYTDLDSQDCILQTFTATRGEHPLFCLRPTTNAEASSCSGLGSAIKELQQVSNPGSWEVTDCQAIIGIRQSKSLKPKSTVSSPLLNRPISYGRSTSTSVSPTSSQATTPTTLRPRRVSSTNSSTCPPLTSPLPINIFDGPWEIWALSPTVPLTILPLPVMNDDLFVASAGPLVPLGQRSMAIAFGNGVRIVTEGSRRIEERTCESDDNTLVGRINATSKSKSKDGRKKRTPIATVLTAPILSDPIL